MGGEKELKGAGLKNVRIKATKFTQSISDMLLKHSPALTVTLINIHYKWVWTYTFTDTYSSD